jgi:hypothetical protein
MPIKNATFITTKSGLRSGQKINIQSTIRTIDQDFTINKVRMSLKSPDGEFYYIVEASTGRPLGIVRFLQKQLESTNKKVGIFKNEGEVLDTILDIEDIDTITISEQLKINDATKKVILSESITMSESLLRISIDSPPIWVYGPYCPTSDADRKRPAFYDRGCQFT